MKNDIEKLVMLDYTFMFDPKDTYQHMYQFEQDLGSFFKEHDMEATAVKTISGGSSKNILYVCRKAALPPPPPPSKKQPSQVLNKMSSKFVTNQQKVLEGKK